MKLGLLGKVLIPVLIVITFVTGIGFYWSYSVSKNAIETIVMEELEALNELLSRNIDTFVTAVQRDLDNLSHFSFITAVLNGNANSLPDLQRLIERFVTDFVYAETVVVVDDKGVVISSTDKKILGQSLASRGYIQTALRGTVSVSEVFTSSASGNTVFCIAVPVEVNGRTAGAIFAAVPAHVFSDEMIKNVHVGQEGYPFIASQNGIFLAHPVAENIGKVNINDFDWGKKAMQMNEGSLSYTWENVDKVVTILLNKKTGWRTFFSIDKNYFAEKIAPAVKSSVLAMIFVLFVLSVAMFLLLRFYVSRPLGSLAFAARQVAGGDINLNLDKIQQEFVNKGEITETYSSIKAMLNSLRENIALANQKTNDAAQQTELAKQATAEAEKAKELAEKAKSDGMRSAAMQLEESISVISSAVDRLSTQIATSQHGAEDQSARVSEAATAMEEMNSTVMEVAKNASATSQVSSNTREKAEEGVHIVQKVVESIRNVQKQSVSLKEDMNVLSNHAQSINQIMGVISDIADQTNLLALNAAIEAARAGEAGRGFAVVADEVRKLAEKTMSSTSDVGNAIKSIQESAVKNMKQVDLTVQTIETTTSLADSSGSVLQDILGMADSTALQVSSIATASEEQSSSSEEINRSITHVSEIASQTSHTMNEAADSIASLATQAQHLQELVRHMKNS
ncbi:methyl-accepting chemotaxis protein [Desulfovibrio litoralis]|uniref:Methyl-accepting chemotaxis sensory transducer with Cache sensor n=1 Tax=Desulfovibrio litoralis DSM 11393 TaxID=1121455 RepID=A0A1M7T5H9_9BACT|nr:methyl-accepting chemotaxis protein [Desulfovibrio litoralis]SHN65945.1 methyl-accepting chemotaxis sensory transducer with Cache sensor [Desulfovibrio litoralis DSM 11393]